LTHHLYLWFSLFPQTPTSWLEGMWDTGYLAYRVPVPINVNPIFAFEDDPAFVDTAQHNHHVASSSSSTGFSCQAARGASLIAASLRFLSQVRGNALEPDNERGTSLCMCQYGRVFGSCRIPLPNRDELVSSPHSRHVIVACRGQFSWFDVLDAGGDVMAEADIRSNLQSIVDEASLANDHGPANQQPSIGLFTTLDRDEWASRRSELIGAGELNTQSLRVIETALFVVCLDESEPAGLEELSRVLLHSDGKNRFFDKSIQIVVCRNAKAGINMEHSGLDGQTVLRYAAAIYSDSKQNRDQTRESLTLTSTPTRLRWVMTDSLRRGLNSADKTFRKFVNSIDLAFLGFDEFGKRLAISRRVSPDALVQLAFQLAFFRLFGRPGSTYESVSTKNFYHGRTECLRSSTREALAMCKTLLAADANAEEKDAAIRAAAAAHISRAKQCKQGLGVDRHMLGLLTMAKQNRDLLPGVEIPALFTDRTYGRYTTDLMSTSNCGNEALNLFGFGPVVQGGFGLGYIIRQDSVHINITSNAAGAAGKFREALASSLREIGGALLEKKSEDPRPKL
jgi:carnitine O-acetyltransferase